MTYTAYLYRNGQPSTSDIHELRNSGAQRHKYLCKLHLFAIKKKLSPWPDNSLAALVPLSPENPAAATSCILRPLDCTWKWKMDDSGNANASFKPKLASLCTTNCDEALTVGGCAGRAAWQLACVDLSIFPKTELPGFA
eukprot:1161509-Pelagomonas_calceolata.AAC.1